MCCSFCLPALLRFDCVWIEGDRIVEGSSAQNANRIRSVVYEVYLRSTRIIWDMWRIHIRCVYVVYVLTWRIG
jgi:hypothetical protein